MSENEDLTKYIENERLAGEALSKCYEYWQQWTELCKEQGIAPNAVVWVQHNETKHMMAFTRGEHAEDLKEFIDNLE